MSLIRMGLKSSNKCPKRREKETRLTEERWCEERGRDWSYAATSQGTPRTAASSHQELGERHGTESLPQSVQKEPTPSDP